MWELPLSRGGPQLAPEVGYRFVEHFIAPSADSGDSRPNLYIALRLLDQVAVFVQELVSLWTKLGFLSADFERFM